MAEVTSSGREVPTATTVNPITASEMPAAVANPIAPATRKRAPRIVSAMPPRAKGRASHSDLGAGWARSASCSCRAAAASGVRRSRR